MKKIKCLRVRLNEQFPLVRVRRHRKEFTNYVVGILNECSLGIIRLEIEDSETREKIKTKRKTYFIEGQ